MENTYTRRQYIIAAIIVFIGAIFFSTKAVLVKMAYQYEIDSVSLIALRMLFALPIFLAVAFYSSRNASADQYKLTQKDWVLMALLGMSGYYVASAFDFEGLQYISASLERIILYLYPTLVLLFSRIFLKKKILPIQMLAIAITYIGVGIAFYENLGLQGEGDTLIGGALVFGAATSFAIYMVGSGELLPKIGTLRYNSIAMTFACFGILTHNFIANGFDLLDFHPNIYWLALLIALIATVIPSFMIAEGIRVIGSNNASIIGSVGPVSTIVLAYLLLDERLGWLQILGTGFVIIGVLVITLNKRK